VPDLAELNLVINSVQADVAALKLKQLEEQSKKTEGAAHNLTSAHKEQESLLEKLHGGYTNLLGVLGLAAGGIEGVRLAYEALQAYGHEEQLVFQFTAIFHSAEAAKGMIEKMNEATSGTAFSGESLAPMIQNLMRVGYSANEALDMLTSLMNMAAARGTGINGVEDVTQALVRMSMAGKVTQMELRVLRNAGIDIVHDIANETGTTSEIITNNIEKGLISVKAIIEAVKQKSDELYTGMAQKQGGTLEGLWAQWKNEAELTFVEVGKALDEAFNIKGALANMIGWLKEFKGEVHLIASDIVAWELSLSNAWKWLNSMSPIAIIIRLALETAAFAVGVIVASSLISTMTEVMWTSMKFAANMTLAAASTNAMMNFSIAMLVALTAAGNQINHIEGFRKSMSDTLNSTNEGFANVVMSALEMTGQTDNALYRDAKANVKNSRIEQYNPPNSSTAPVSGDDLAGMLKQYMSKLAPGIMGGVYGSDDMAKLTQQAKDAEDRERAFNQKQGGSNQHAGSLPAKEALEDMDKQIQLQKMSNNEGEVATQIWKFQKLELETYGTDLTHTTAAMDTLTNKLKELQKAKGDKLVSDTNKDYDRQLELLTLTADQAERQQLDWKLIDAGVDMAGDNVEKLHEKLEQLQDAKELKAIADSIGESFGRAFESAILDAKSFGDVFKSLMRDIEQELLHEMVTKQLVASISGGLQKLVGSVNLGGTNYGSPTLAADSASGDAYAGAIGHATGGIIDSPTYFTYHGQRHVMGEAGPEEIRPLGSKGGSGTTIHMTVVTPDADSFRRSRVQVANDIKRGLQ